MRKKLGKDLVVGDVLILWCGCRRINNIQEYDPPPAMAGLWKNGARIANWKPTYHGADSGIAVGNDELFDVE